METLPQQESKQYDMNAHIRMEHLGLPWSTTPKTKSRRPTRGSPRIKGQNPTQHEKKYTIPPSLQTSHSNIETENENEQESGVGVTHTNLTSSESTVENWGVIETVNGCVHARLKGFLLTLLCVKEHLCVYGSRRKLRILTTKDTCMSGKHEQNERSKHTHTHVHIHKRYGPPRNRARHLQAQAEYMVTVSRWHAGCQCALAMLACFGSTSVHTIAHHRSGKGGCQL
jgi:hypothetical protein